MIDILVRIKNAAFKTGLQQMESDAEKFQANVSKSIAGAFNVNNLIGPLSAGLAAVSAGFSVGKALEMATDISEVARRFNITAEDAQRLGAAARKMGTDMETVAKGGFKAFLEAQKAVAGDDSARQKFEALNISMEKLANLRGPVDTIMALADAVHGAADQHVALAAAGDLVGTRQAGLIRLFQQGGTAIKAMGDAAPIMSNKTVDELERTQKSINRFQREATIVAGGLFAWLIKYGQILSTIWSGVFLAMKDDIEGLLKAAERLAHADFKGAGHAVSEAGRNVKSDTSATFQQVKDLYNDKGTGAYGDDEDGPPAGQIAEDEKEREEAERAAEESARKVEQTQDEIARIKERIAKMDEENRLANESSEKRMADLQGMRLRALADSRNKSTELERVEALEKSKDIEREITEEKKKQAEENQRHADETKRKQAEVAEKKKRHDEELKTALEHERDADERNAYDKLTSDKDRLAFKRKQQARLADEATKDSKAGDDIGASKKRAEAKEMQPDIDKLDYAVKHPNKAAARELAVDSLQRIGGGGRAAFSSSLNKVQHVELDPVSKGYLKTISEKVAKDGGQGLDLALL